MDKNNIIKLDRVDKKILSTIELDARIPISELARKVRVSRTIAEYRLAQLQEKEIIRGYYCLLDPSKFGLTVWKLWASLRPVSPEQRKEFFSYIERHPRVWWYAEGAGIYDAVICILANNPHEFNNFFNSLQDKYGRMIVDSAILINVSFEYHTRGFLLDIPSKLIETSFQEKPLLKSISEEALKILQLLSENSRISYAELAKRTELNVKTINKIIRGLKESGVIVYFRPSVDMSKIGYENYKVFLCLHNPRGGVLPSIVHWCREQKNITAIISCVGPWQLELEIEIDNFRNLASLLINLKDRFPDTIRNYETLLITREGNYQLNLIDKIKRINS